MISVLEKKKIFFFVELVHCTLAAKEFVYIEDFSFSNSTTLLDKTAFLSKFCFMFSSSRDFGFGNHVLPIFHFFSFQIFLL